MQIFFNLINLVQKVKSTLQSHMGFQFLWHATPLLKKLETLALDLDNENLLPTFSAKNNKKDD